MAITRKDLDVLFHARKSVLYNDGEPWVKKEGGSFDVTMGAHDGVDVREFIGIYVLYLIGKKYDSKKKLGYIEMTDKPHSKMYVDQPQKKKTVAIFL